MLALHVHSLSLHVADSEQDDVKSQERKQCTEVSHDQKCHHMDEASSNTSSMPLIRYTILALYKFICMYVMPFTLLHESTSHETCHLITESFPKLTHNIYYPVSRLPGPHGKKVQDTQSFSSRLTTSPAPADIIPARITIINKYVQLGIDQEKFLSVHSTNYAY